MPKPIQVALTVLFVLPSTAVLGNALEVGYQGQSPPNPVPQGQAITYRFRTVNVDDGSSVDSDGIGVGIGIWVDGVRIDADSGTFAASGCHVDPSFPWAWACNSLGATGSAQDLSFTWTVPGSGEHDVRLRGYCQEWPVPSSGPRLCDVNGKPWGSEVAGVETIVGSGLAVDYLGQDPPNDVSRDTVPTYGFTIEGLGPGQIGTGFRIYVNGSLAPAHEGGFASAGCSVDANYPEAWACNNLWPGGAQTLGFTWLSPPPGTFVLEFRAACQELSSGALCDVNGLPWGSVVASATTVVINQPPDARIESPIGDLAIAQGTPVWFAGSATDPEDDLPFIYLWDFDGVAPNSALEDPGNVVFHVPGTYTITLGVTDRYGAHDPTPATVRVDVLPADCSDDPLGDADADGVCGSVDNCPLGFNPDQAPALFGRTLLATTPISFQWGDTLDVAFARGALDTVALYAIDRAGILFAADGLDDAFLPAPGTGRWFLVRLAGECAASSWQSLPPAAGDRDGAGLP